MSRIEKGEPVLDAITIQTLPDGIDNLNGLLTALVRYVGTDEVSRRDCPRDAFQHRSGGRPSRVRAAWLGLRRYAG